MGSVNFNFTFSGISGIYWFPKSTFDELWPETVRLNCRMEYAHLQSVVPNVDFETMKYGSELYYVALNKTGYDSLSHSRVFQKEKKNLYSFSPSVDPNKAICISASL